MIQMINGSVTERIAHWMGPQTDPPFDIKTDLTVEALNLYARALLSIHFNLLIACLLSLIHLTFHIVDYKTPSIAHQMTG